MLLRVYLVELAVVMWIYYHPIWTGDREIRTRLMHKPLASFLSAGVRL